MPNTVLGDVSRLIPDPLVVYTNIDLPDGSGIRNNEKKSALCGRPIHCARFCSYAFLSKCIRVNMKFKKSCKLQASSFKLDNGVG